MLISLIGNVGSGKTLFLVLLSYIYSFFDKRKIHANFYIKLENCIALNLPNFIENERDNMIVFLDEAYTYLESRISMSHLNKAMSYVIFQSRKRNLDIYLTAQMFSTIDVRFREQTDILIKCKRIINDNFNGFKYKIINLNSESIKTMLFPMSEAKTYFHLYNTYEIIPPYQKDKMVLEILKNTDYERYKYKIHQIAESIKPKLKKITHPSVKTLLFENGYNASIEQDVYIYLKGKEYIIED